MRKTLLGCAYIAAGLVTIADVHDRYDCGAFKTMKDVCLVEAEILGGIAGLAWPAYWTARAVVAIDLRRL